MRTHATFMKDLETLLSESLTSKEREIFQAAKDRLEKDEYLMRVVEDLKKALSRLALAGQLSPSAVDFYSELSRRHPTTGVASMWNFLVKPTKNS